MCIRDSAHAQEIWEEYLERIKVENCRVERENQAFILRNGSFSLPGVCYDALPEGSFRGSGWYGGFTKYRAADQMCIRDRSCTGQNIRNCGRWTTSW